MSLQTSYFPSIVLSADSSLSSEFRKQIDEQIDVNTRLIAESLNRIEGLLTDLPTSESESYDDPNLEDLLESVSNFHVIEKTACYDLDVNDLKVFLSKLNEYITNHPGSEEQVYNLLVELCAHSGFSLPWKKSSNEMEKSSLSLNAVTDEEEQVCEALWSEVRRLLEDQIVARLYQLPNDDNSLVAKQIRFTYIDKLNLLMTKRQLCQQYRSLRVYSLNQLINNELSGVGDAPPFTQIVTAFERISEQVLKMIDCDFHLLISGIFRQISTPFELISSIYFDKLVDEIASVLDEFGNDLYGLVEPRLSHRRQSDMDLSERLTADKIKKTISKGKLDTDVLIEPISQLTDAIVDAMIRLCKTFHSIDQHVYNLYLLSYTGLRDTSAKSMFAAKNHLRGVLKSTSITDISLLSESITSDTEDDFTSVLRATRIHTLDQKDKAPQVVDKPAHHDKPLFLWQDSLKRFTKDLSNAIDTRITQALNICLLDLKSARKTENIRLCPTQRGGTMEYPVTICKSVSDFILTLESLLPLAQAGQSMMSLRQTFVNVTVAHCKTLLDTLNNMIELRIAAGEDNSVILLALSCVAVIRNTLYQCDLVFGKDSDKQNTFVLIYHQFCQAVDQLALQYVTAEVNFINNLLLHDAESFNWSENKEFYEAERCSFPIQAWSYHMQAIRISLWTICPPSNASAILGDILRQTLDNLTLRYLAESPSYRRVEQYRMDIAMILDVVSELMFYICHSPTQLLDIKAIALEQPYLTIHSCCCKLLASLAIITSPLDELYRVYRRGYQKKCRRMGGDSADSLIGYYSHWLSWIKPHLFTRGQLSLNEMQTTNALYIALKMMFSQPEPLWSSLVQVITMKDFTLAIMLLTQADTKLTAGSTTEHLNPRNQGYRNPAYLFTTDERQSTRQELSTPELSCQLGFCDGMCKLSTDGLTLFEPFMFILSKSEKPTVLYDVLLPVINRNHQWSLFKAASFYKIFSENPPDWYPAVVKLMRSTLRLSVQSTVLSLCGHMNQTQKPALDVNKFITTLPCGCPIDSQNIHKSTHEVDLMIQILESLFIGLSTGVSRLPLTVCILLKKLGEEYNKQAEIEEDCEEIVDRFILQFVGLAMAQCLIDMEFIEDCVEGVIPAAVYDKLQEASPCVYALLSSDVDNECLELFPLQKSVVSSNHSEWVDHYKASVLTNIYNRDSSSAEGGANCSSASFNYVEWSDTVLTNEVLETKEGRQYMRTVYNIISNNIDWIYRSLDIHECPDEPEATDNHVSHFIPDTTDYGDERIIEAQNPLILYRKIGNVPVNFERYRNIITDWAHLLQSDLGLSDLNISATLQRRHEFQESNYLEPQEKKQVDTLRTKFAIVSPQS